MTHPLIIQGGMGIGISNWTLANAVAKAGELGVVSGTAIAALFIRRLQDGDLGGHMRDGIAQFPDKDVALEVLNEYFLPEGRPADTPYKRHAHYSLRSGLKLLQLTVVANFVEVYLAKRGHSGLVGINLLEKIQLPNLASLYGAMLAGVDYVLMGAGIPREIPGALDQLSRRELTKMRIQVEGAGPDEIYHTEFDPQTVLNTPGAQPLKRPHFLAIVSSATLATNLARKSTGRVDGFVVENHTAGGHNAPPRGTLKLNERGEPIYGPKDIPDLNQFIALERPFWLAGSFGSAEKLAEAQAQGATGIQVGTAFALAHESGLDPGLRSEILEKLWRREALKVRTDPLASPSGFPFKVAELEGTVGSPDMPETRVRKCDLGYLRSGYLREDGTVGFRCASEPIATYLRKGGKVEDTVQQKCLCNGLMATAGFAQTQESGYIEQPIVTMGDELSSLRRLMSEGHTHYSALDVISDLRRGHSLR